MSRSSVWWRYLAGFLVLLATGVLAQEPRIPRSQVPATQPADGDAAGDDALDLEDQGSVEGEGKSRSQALFKGYRVVDERLFRVTVEGEPVGRARWQTLHYPRTGALVEVFEREMFPRTPSDSGERTKREWRYWQLDKQSTSRAKIIGMWGTLRDEEFGGRFRLKSAGRSARLSGTYGHEATPERDFPAGPGYESMREIRQWCVENRAATGARRTYERPVWFAGAPEWGRWGMIAEGKESVRMPEGVDQASTPEGSADAAESAGAPGQAGSNALEAWRFRIEFEDVEDVHSVVWLDSEGRPVQWSLPYCGVTFRWCGAKEYEDLSGLAAWETARQQWELGGEAPLAVLLAEAQARRDQAEQSGVEVGEMPAAAEKRAVPTTQPAGVGGQGGDATANPLPTTQPDEEGRRRRARMALMYMIL